MEKRQLIARKPAYWNGKLLLENHFIDEQQFHLHARYLHSRALHGFGAVHGLEVAPAGDLAVTVTPGFAVDRRGHEIELREPETLELHGLPAGALAWVTIGYRSEQASKDGGGDKRIDCYAQLRLATGVAPDDVRLAAVQLDERGRIVRDGIRTQERDQLRTPISPGSVGAEALDAQLRKDWLTLAFHPSPMPQDQDGARPPFRIGATQAMAHKDYDNKPNTRGAAGTMPLLLPPGVRRILRFRVAGAECEKKLTATLVRGGFDEQTKKHLRDELLTLEVAGGGGGYLETGDIPEAQRGLADRLRTLAVDVQSHGYCKISLIALEVSY